MLSHFYCRRTPQNSSYQIAWAPVTYYNKIIITLVCFDDYLFIRVSSTHQCAHLDIIDKIEAALQEVTMARAPLLRSVHRDGARVRVVFADASAEEAAAKLAAAR